MRVTWGLKIPQISEKTFTIKSKIDVANFKGTVTPHSLRGPVRPNKMQESCLYKEFFIVKNTWEDSKKLRIDERKTGPRNECGVTGSLSLGA